MITETEQAIRKAKILAAAYTLFCKNGIEKVAISGIAKAAGQSQNSVYRYFDNKFNLVFCVAKYLAKDCADNIISSLEDEYSYAALSGREQLGLLLPKFIEHYTNHREYLIFREDYRHYMSMGGRMSLASEIESLNPILEPIIATFFKGKLDGSLKCEDPVAEGYMVWSLARGHMSNVVLWDRTFKNEGDGEKVMRLGIDFILKSLG